MAGLNALQGESLSFDTESQDEVQDEPCPIDDELLSPIGAGIYPASKLSFLCLKVQRSLTKKFKTAPHRMPKMLEAK